MPNWPEPFDARYLTPEEKQRHLQEITADLLDPGIQTALLTLNALDGVCTVQSCVGHSVGLDNGSRHVESGHIEMRLDEPRFRAFYAAMPMLRALIGAEDAEITWRPGYQICRVVFLPGRAAAVSEALMQALQSAPTPTPAPEKP